MESKIKMHLDNLDALISSPKNLDNVRYIKDEITKKDIYIYGAGFVGGTIYNLLKGLHFPVKAFLDKRGGEGIYFKNIPVMSANSGEISNSEKQQAVVVVSFNCYNKEFEGIKNWLSSLGFFTILHYGSIYNYIITKKIKEDVLKVASLFHDVTSQSVYYSYINALIHTNSDLYPQSENKPQYIMDDYCFDYSRIIDCGAYDGDSALNFKKYRGTLEAIALFEPDDDNFSKLKNTVEMNEIAKEHYLYPYGVWKKTEKLRFQDRCQTSSIISDDGKNVIQAVALDDVLPNFAPTFIKMDVEGAEYNALLGAKKLIEKYKPGLAICVYHAKEDLWNIPLIINQFNKEYKFFLRTYDALGIETVLYATCNNKG